MPRAPFGSTSPVHPLCAGVVLLVACTWPHPAAAQQGPFEAPALVNASLAALLATPQPFGRSVPPRVGTITPLHAEPREPVPAPASGPARPLRLVCGAAGSRRPFHADGASAPGAARSTPRSRASSPNPPRSWPQRSRQPRERCYLDRAPLEETPRRRRGADGRRSTSTYGAIVAHNYRGRPLNPAPAPLLPSSESAPDRPVSFAHRGGPFRLLPKSLAIRRLVSFECNKRVVEDTHCADKEPGGRPTSLQPQ